MTTTRGLFAAEHGPLLLSHLEDGPSLAAHRDRFGAPVRVGLDALVAMAEAVSVRGRGGAGFPFAVKLRTAAQRRRPVVVVNAAEGEPASCKDAALAQLVPHRILDGAVTVASALGTSTIHVVTPSERPGVGVALERAADERRRSGERMSWRWHEAAPRFVSGQSRAVLELMAGRENLPVTAWQPEAVAGHRGRPTLLSNAETWAHMAMVARLGPQAYSAYGRHGEAGTTLLTLDGDGDAVVREVALGTPWAEVLTSDQLSRPVLTGGYHGTWAQPGALQTLRVSRHEMASRGLTLGAGVVLATAPDECPVDRTLRIVDYLAGESAGRCGPCLNGLPALAGALHRAAGGVAGGGPGRVRALLDMVEGRGACAHPDGTARLVRSLLHAFPGELEEHARGVCSLRGAPAFAWVGSVGGPV